MEQENLWNEEELSAQLIQECIANLQRKRQEREEQKRVEVLAARKAEKTIPLPTYMKVTDEGFLQYEESSCLPTPNGENIGIRPIGNALANINEGQITEKLYSVDDMILLAGEIATNEMIVQPSSELLYQKVWAHVKSTLPIECKEDYVKSMVRSAIVMYLESIIKSEFRSVIFSNGEDKIYVDKSSPHIELDVGFYYCPYNPFEDEAKQDHIDNYDHAMKFVV